LFIITAGSDMAGDLGRRPSGRLLEQLRRRHHAGNQAGALGLGGVHHAAGQDISIALDLPTKRVRRWVPPMPGMTPR
jgi:hypothetical protein